VEQVTIVIQGPIHEHSLRMVDTYLKYGPVVISGYDNDSIPAQPPGVTVIKSMGPLVDCRAGNLYLQAWSTLMGLNAVHTPYFIKTRADEQYSNLQPMIDRILSPGNSEKYISSNIFYKGHVEPLHPSDHLFGGNTAIFKKAFWILNTAIQYTRNPSLKGYDLGADCLGDIGAEVAIFLSFLLANKKYGTINPLYPDQFNDLFLDNTELVNIDELGPYIWSMSLEGKRLYHTTSEPMYEKYPSLKSKDEYFTTTYTI